MRRLLVVILALLLTLPLAGMLAHDTNSAIAEATKSQFSNPSSHGTSLAVKPIKEVGKEKSGIGLSDYGTATSTGSLSPLNIGALRTTTKWHLKGWKYRKLVVIRPSYTGAKIAKIDMEFNPPAHVSSIRVIWTQDGSEVPYQLDNCQFVDNEHISYASIWIRWKSEFYANYDYYLYVYWDNEPKLTPYYDPWVTYSLDSATGEYTISTRTYKVVIKDGEILKFYTYNAMDVSPGYQLQDIWGPDEKYQRAFVIRHHVSRVDKCIQGNQFPVVRQGIRRSYPNSGVIWVDYECIMKYPSAIVSSGATLTVVYRFFPWFIVTKLKVDFNSYIELGEFYVAWELDQDIVDGWYRTYSKPGIFVYKVVRNYFGTCSTVRLLNSWPIMRYTWVFDRPDYIGYCHDSFVSDWKASYSGLPDYLYAARLRMHEVPANLYTLAFRDILNQNLMVVEYYYREVNHGYSGVDYYYWYGTVLASDMANDLHLDGDANAVVFPIYITPDIADFWFEAEIQARTTFPKPDGGDCNDNTADDADGAAIMFLNELNDYGGIRHYPWNNVETRPLPTGGTCGASNGGYYVKLWWYGDRKVQLCRDGSVLREVANWLKLRQHYFEYYYEFEDGDFYICAWTSPYYIVYIRANPRCSGGYGEISAQVKDSTNNREVNLGNLRVSLADLKGAFAVSGATGAQDMDIFLSRVSISFNMRPQIYSKHWSAGGNPGDYLLLYYTSGYSYSSIKDAAKFLVKIAKSVDSYSSVSKYGGDRLILWNKANFRINAYGFLRDDDDVIVAGVRIPNFYGNAGDHYYLELISTCVGPDKDPSFYTDQYANPITPISYGQLEGYYCDLTIKLYDANGNLLPSPVVNFDGQNYTLSDGTLQLNGLERKTYTLTVWIPSGLCKEDGREVIFTFSYTITLPFDYSVLSYEFSQNVPVTVIKVRTYWYDAGVMRVVGGLKVYVVDDGHTQDITYWWHAYTGSEGTSQFYVETGKGYYLLIYADDFAFTKSHYSYNTDLWPDGPTADNMTVLDASGNTLADNVLYHHIAPTGYLELKLIDLLITEPPAIVYPEIVVDRPNLRWGEVYSDAVKVSAYYLDWMTGEKNTALVDMTITIFDMTIGRTVKEFTVNNVADETYISFDTSDLTAGHCYRIYAKISTVLFPTSSDVGRNVTAAQDAVYGTFFVSPRETLLQVEFAGGYNTPVWGEKVTLLAVYKDKNTDAFLADAEVIVELYKGTALIAGPYKMNLYESDDTEYFYWVFDTYELGCGAYTVKVTASKPNYEGQTMYLAFFVRERPTSIRNATSYIRITWMPYYDNITFVYWDDWANVPIAGATVDVKVLKRTPKGYETKPYAIRNITFDEKALRYRLSIDIEKGLGDIGIYEIWLHVYKTNYEDRYLTIILEVTKIYLELEMSKYYIEVTWGDKAYLHVTAKATGTNGTWYINIQPRIKVEVVNTTAPMDDVPVFYTLNESQTGIFMLFIDSGKTLPGEYKITLTLDETVSDKLAYYTGDSKVVTVVIKKVVATLDLMIDESMDSVAIKKIPGQSKISSLSVVFREVGGQVLSRAKLKIVLKHGTEVLTELIPTEDPYLVGVYRAQLDWLPYEPGIYRVEVYVISFERKGAVAPLSGYNISAFVDISGHTTVIVHLDYVMGEVEIAGYRAPTLVAVPMTTLGLLGLVVGLYKYAMVISLPPEIRELDRLIRNIENDKYEYSAPGREEIIFDVLLMELGSPLEEFTDEY